MQLGPVEYIVIGFPGNHFKGKIAPALQASWSMRRLSALWIWYLSEKRRMAASPASRRLRCQRLNSAVFGASRYSADGLLNEQDIALIAQDLPNNSSAGLLVWENLWAALIAEAVRNPDGFVLDNARIPHDIIVEAIGYATRLTNNPKS